MSRRARGHSASRATPTASRAARPASDVCFIATRAASMVVRTRACVTMWINPHQILFFNFQFSTRTTYALLVTVCTFHSKEENILINDDGSRRRRTLFLSSHTFTVVMFIITKSHYKFSRKFLLFVLFVSHVTWTFFGKNVTYTSSQTQTSTLLYS